LDDDIKNLLIGETKKRSMAKFMEDGDVDEWFEQESEKISKKMYIELEKGADYDIAKVKFDKLSMPY
jgi:hypothetical protein